MTKRKGNGLTRLALIIAAAAFILFFIGGPGFRFGLWSYETGFMLLRYGAYVGVVAAILGILPLLHLIWRERKLSSLLAVIIGVFVFMSLQGYKNKARQVPAIHDISTDLDNPPQYLFIKARDEAERGFTDTQHRALQEVYYEDIHSMNVPKNVTTTTEALHQVLQNMGMEIIHYNAPGGRIEAVATTSWFGFKDDVVVRVQASPNGSVIDVRSVSRVGRSDIGKNAERIRKILKHAKDKLAL
ncbi:MAG: DUF1499 domain-containing protein [Sphingomonadales bacterium]|jgi:uncharacterized protein (DUF1499 family)